MTDIPREDWPSLIKALEAAGVSLHKQSLLLLQLGCMCQFTQLKRIKNGEQRMVEHFMGECIKAVHRDHVPHETLRS